MYSSPCGAVHTKNGKTQVIIMKKTLGILGGMGPLATADLFTKIVTMTKADCDNDHIRIFIDNNAQIKDRTAAILHGGQSPLPQLMESAKKLEKMGADCIIMPCNTAHYFLQSLQMQVKVPFLSMIGQAVRVAKQRYPGQKAGILATTGTLDAGVYSRAFMDEGVEVVLPDEEQRRYLMSVIYDGVKAGKMPTDPEPFNAVLREMESRGAGYFILGCTELPVAVQSLGLENNFVDATTELAKAAIEYCGYEVKE